MEKKPPEIIDAEYRIVDDGGGEPIIKSWAGLIMFLGSLAVAIALRTAHFKGWL